MIDLTLYLQYLPVFASIWFHLAHLLDILFHLIRSNPILFLSLSAAVLACCVYVYVHHENEVREWFATLMGPALDEEELASRKEVEVLMEEDGDLSNLSESIYRWTGPASVKALLLRKLRQAEKMGGVSSAEVDRTWIERVLQLPLNVTTPIPAVHTPELLRQAKDALDRTLVGQTEVKVRILEILSSWLRKPDSNPPVLGLLGPPGVGKTTIARCISEVLQRPCRSIGFGGRKDSAEIKGHSPTYVGSQWGAIVQALVEARSMDPVLYLDEVDKIGGAFGSGSEVHHVLLHATDPSQNTSFQDAYLPGIPVDLSRCVFILSFNDLASIPRPLQDRIQLVHMSGYDLETKSEILEQKLWKEVLVQLGVEGRMELDPEAALHLVDLVQSEPGVRRLRQTVETVVRRAALLQDITHQPELLRDIAWTEPVPEGVWLLDKTWVERLLLWTEAHGSPVS